MKRIAFSATRRFFLSFLTIASLAFLALMWKGALPGGATSARKSAALPAAAAPALNLIEFPGMALAGESFCYTARITNTGDQNGPSPYLQLTLPPGVTIDSVVGVGICGNSSSCTPTSTYPINPIDSGVFDNAGKTTDVLSGKTVNGVPGNHLWLLQPPIGSLAPFSTTTQGIDLRICLKLDAGAAVNSVLKICHTPVFLLSGSSSIEGAQKCNDVIASVVKLRKRALALPSNNDPNTPISEAVTGSCNLITFELVADIADGKTITGIVFNDIFSKNGSLVEFELPANPGFLVNNSASGFAATIYADKSGFEVKPSQSFTGTANSQDIVVRFQAYIYKDLILGQTCDTKVVTNKATLDAFFNGTAITQQSDEIKIEAKQVSMWKTASPQSVMPGDIINYALNFRVSQNVITNNVFITDELPNGIGYLGNACLRIPSTSSNCNPITGMPVVDALTGKTTVAFSGFLQNNQFGACNDARVEYQGMIKAAYDPPISQPVLASDVLTNKAIIGYTNPPGGQRQCYGAEGEDAAATVMIIPPQIEKSIVNPKPEYSAGEEVTFKLKMCLPSGDAKQVVFTDFLPPQLFDATAVDLSGANVKLTVSPSGITPPIAAAASYGADNSLVFAFMQAGQTTLTTNGAQTLCLEIEFKAKIKTGAPPDKKDFANLFQGKVLNSTGEAIVQQTGIVLNLAQPKPELIITKTVCDTPASLDAGDKVTFCITIKNESTATAYNAKATDIVPATMSYVSNSLVQVGSTPSLTLNDQNPSTTGLTATANALNPGQSFSIKFAVTLGNDVEPCQTYTNTADISWTASSNSTIIFTGESATATVTIAKPTITKTIKSTSAPHTTNPEVAIGEEIVYEVKVCLPEGKTPKVTVTDALPPNVQCTKVTPGGLFSGNLSCPGPSWTFNNISVPGDNNPANNCGTVEIKTIVKDNSNPANIGCMQNQTAFQNIASAKVGQCDTITSLPVRSLVVEPKLNIKKEFIPATAKPGDVVTIKLTLSNDGTSSCMPTSSAFDVVLQDKLPANFTNVTADKMPAGFAYSYNSGANQVTYTSGKDVEVKAKAVLEFTFKATVQKPCGMIPNTATIVQATTMGGPIPVDGERTITSPISTVATGASTATLTVAGGSCGCADPAQITGNMLPNLIGWWPFDDGAGASVVKEIAKNYSGKPYTSAAVATTINGTGGPTQLLNQFVTSSFTFANASYVNVPDNNDLDIGTNDFTIDAWIRPPAGSPPASVPIVTKLDLGTQKGYGLYYDPSGKLRLIIGSPLQTYTSTKALTLAQAQWQFVAVTVRRQPSQVTFYVGSNPPDVITAQPVTTASIANTKDLRLGPGQIVLPTQGYDLDEVEIFNTALPPDKIELIRKAQEIGKCKDNTCLTNPVKILTTSLPSGKKGQPYFAPILVSGGVAPYKFEVSQGSLPPGLTLDKNTGIISGISQTSSSPTFVVKVTDARGCTAMAKYQLVIKLAFMAMDYNVSATAGFASADPSAQQNGTFILSVNAEMLGGEKSGSFSLSYDPALLVNPVVTLGSGAAGATLVTNTSQAAQGRLGIQIALPGDQTFAEGYWQIARVSFGLVLRSPAPITKIEFGDVPIARAMSDGGGNSVEMQFQNTPAVLASKVVTVSAANYAGDRLASEQIVAAFGTNLATGVQVASGSTLPTNLLGTSISIKDSAGIERPASLFFVSPSQINYLLPAGLASGAATVSITSGGGAASGGVIQITPVAPGIFTADASGRGIPAANLFRLHADGSSVTEPIAFFDPAQGKIVPKPIDAGEEGDRIFLILFATAVKGRSDLAAVEATIGGLPAEVSYAGAQGSFFGLDQINIEIPRSLAGQGLVDVLLTVDGATANIVQISIL